MLESTSAFSTCSVIVLWTPWYRNKKGLMLLRWATGGTTKFDVDADVDTTFWEFAIAVVK